MRIITGIYRGKKLQTLEGVTTRPTTDFIREMIFSALYDMDVDMSNVLDLYAGCGSLGFEALSRGAERVTFVEGSKKAVSTLIANITELKCKDKCKIGLKKVETYLRSRKSEVGSRNEELKSPLPPFKKGGDCGRPPIYLSQEGNDKYSLVFLDPPYDKGLVNVTLGLLFESSMLSDDCVIVAEHSYSEPIDECFREYVIKEKVNKPIVVTFFTASLSSKHDLTAGVKIP